MINVVDIITDPDLAQDYIVYRKNGYWSEGDFKQTETPLNFYGAVLPPDDTDIEQVPEGDRFRGVMTFWSDQEIFMTRNEANNKGTSDEIEWKKERYRIYRVRPLEDFGFWKAIGARMRGD